MNKEKVIEFKQQEDLIKEKCLEILDYYLSERWGHTSTGVANAGYTFGLIYYNEERDNCGTFSYNHWHDGPGPQGCLTFPLDLLWDSDWKTRISKVAESGKEKAEVDRTNTEEFDAELKILCSKYNKPKLSSYDFRSVPIYTGGPSSGTVYTEIKA